MFDYRIIIASSIDRYEYVVLFGAHVQRSRFIYS